MNPTLRTAGIYLVLALAGGCGSGANFAPVADRYNPPEHVPSHYVVSRGDTLYSIAWRYGMDYRKLAAANEIAAPHRIYPGQKLVMKEVEVSAPRSRRDSRTRIATVSPDQRSNSRTESKPSGRRSPSSAVSPPAASLSQTGWRWPNEGRVTKTFTTSGREHKGIDIAGKLGEPVYAAAAGTVVYAGSGLVGYGNLLIVKHDERYLSAYAHNRHLLVKEGDSVKSGQKIAAMGNSGTESVMLHFEIRRDGKPVDPLHLLPKRN